LLLTVNRAVGERNEDLPEHKIYNEWLIREVNKMLSGRNRQSEE
jgi:hypothetical protein